MGGFYRVCPADAGTGPGRLSPQGPRRQRQGGPRLVRRVARHGTGVCRLRVLRLRGPVVRPWHRGGRGRWTDERRRDGNGEVSDRLRRREVAQRGQHLRHRHDLQLLRGAAALPAPRAVLGHPGRSAHARRDDRSRGEADRRVPLGSVPLCRLPDPDGDQDAVPQDGTHRSEQERRGPVDAALVPGDRQVSRRALHRSRRRAGVVRERGPRCARGAGRGRGEGSAGNAAPHASGAGARHGRDDGSDLRRRLDPGHLCHHGRPFLVFTSNVFAILGLRSLYFALAGMVKKFRYLKAALALVLMVVGVKMLLAEWLKLALGKHFNLYLLMVVFAILAAGVAGSLIAGRKSRDHLPGR